jgi:hypothetical protein
MTTDERADYARKFEEIAGKIQNLSYELTDNKDLKEFIEEMEKLHKDLAVAINIFQKHA